MGRPFGKTVLGLAMAGISTLGSAQSAPNERPRDQERLEFSYPARERLSVRCVREERAGNLSPVCRQFKAKLHRALQRQ
jgi:hypothetical protein